MSSFSSSNSRLPQLGERLDQPHEVLVRLDVADVQDEAVIELVALADARDLLRLAAPPRTARRWRCRRPTIFSGGTLKKCRMSRFDASDTVRMRSERFARAPHRRPARTHRPRGSAGIAETSGGCSRESSRPTAQRTAGGST